MVVWCTFHFKEKEMFARFLSAPLKKGGKVVFSQKITDEVYTTNRFRLYRQSGACFKALFLCVE
jgi:hypothetical protein